MALAGPLTPRQSLRTFADGDSPDLSTNGLTLALTDIDNAIRYRGALTVAQFGGANYGLPTAPADGDVVALIVDAANGVEWELRYVTAEPTYKWRYLGGPPLYSEVAASENTTSVAYAALATAGPAIALPRLGDYDVEIGALEAESAININVYMSYDIGGTGAVDADSVSIGITSGLVTANVHRKRRKTGLTAVTLTAKYKTTSGTGTFASRYMAVTPVRIG